MKDQLTRIERKLDVLFALIQIALFKESKMVKEVQDLVDAVTAETTVVNSAVALINGIPQLITDAVSKAIASGVDPDDLKAITDLAGQVQGASSALQAAVTANTPPAPAPAPTPAP